MSDQPPECKTCRDIFDLFDEPRPLCSDCADKLKAHAEKAEAALKEIAAWENKLATHEFMFDSCVATAKEALAQGKEVGVE